MQLLSHAGLRIPLDAHIASRSGAPNVDDEDLEDGYGGLGTRRKRRLKGVKEKFPTIPDDDGRILMNTGTFGENEYYKDILRKRKPLLATRLMRRELGIDRYSSTRTNKLISQVRILGFYDHSTHNALFSLRLSLRRVSFLLQTQIQ